MKKKMICLAGLLIAASTYAQTDVTTGIMRGKDYGVTYLLPQTEIEIVVEATKHTYMPGEFCKYADRYPAHERCFGRSEYLLDQSTSCKHA